MFGLGLMGLVSPAKAASSLGVEPTTTEGREVADKGMAFLGIRDVVTAVALFDFYRTGKQREMGVVFTAFTLVCVTDTLIATKGPRGWDGGVWTLWAVAAVNVVVGLGLLLS
jgi:hypothetical protein